MMINLVKYEEYSRITSDSDELKTPSVEDKYLARASLHLQKDLSWRYPTPDKNSSPIAWF
jgi:hypothetical protein